MTDKGLYEYEMMPYAERRNRGICIVRKIIFWSVVAFFLVAFIMYGWSLPEV